MIDRSVEINVCFRDRFNIIERHIHGTELDFESCDLAENVMYIKLWKSWAYSKKGTFVSKIIKCDSDVVIVCRQALQPSGHFLVIASASLVLHHMIPCSMTLG